MERSVGGPAYEQKIASGGCLTRDAQPRSSEASVSLWLRRTDARPMLAPPCPSSGSAATMRVMARSAAAATR